MVVTISHLTEKDLKRILKKDRLAPEDKQTIVGGFKHYIETANIDWLTGIPNGSYFNERLIEEIAKALRENTNIATSEYDIKEFKFINDNYGHLTAGDRVLCDFAELLVKNKRLGDIVARKGSGSDEFFRAFININRKRGVDGVNKANRRFSENVKKKMVYSFVNINNNKPEQVNIGFHFGTSYFIEDGAREYALLLYDKKGMELLGVYLDVMESKNVAKNDTFCNMLDRYTSLRKMAKKMGKDKLIKTLGDIRNSGIEYTRDKDGEFYRKVNDPDFLKELAAHIFLDIADKRLIGAKNSKTY